MRRRVRPSIPAASKCPSSRSAHTIRRGYITHELSAGVDRSYVCERCDVPEDIVKLHYDERDERERLEFRHWALENARREPADMERVRNDPIGDSLPLQICQAVRPTCHK